MENLTEKERIAAIVASLPCRTYGMEIEYNADEHYAFKESSPSWIRIHASENEVIYESGTLPCDQGRFLRRLAYLGLEFGFVHSEGEDDARAGSFHLHMGDSEGIPTGSSVMETRATALNPMLAFAQHLSKEGTSDAQWRNAVNYRAKVGVPADSRRSSGRVIEDTKTFWSCLNTAHDTMEIRLNESPCPFIPTLMFPILCHAASPFSITAEVPSELTEYPNDVSRSSPSLMTKWTEENGPTLRVMYNFAIAVYQEAGEDFAVKLLRAAKRGRSVKDLLRIAVEHYTTDEVFLRMLPFIRGYVTGDTPPLTMLMSPAQRDFEMGVNAYQVLLDNNYRRYVVNAANRCVGKWCWVSNMEPTVNARWSWRYVVAVDSSNSRPQYLALTSGKGATQTINTSQWKYAFQTRTSCRE